MSDVYKELVRQRQREYVADATNRRVADRLQAVHRWQGAEAWATRRRVRAQRASQEADNATH